MKRNKDYFHCYDDNKFAQVKFEQLILQSDMFKNIFGLGTVFAIITTDCCRDEGGYNNLWFTKKCILIPSGGNNHWPSDDLLKPYGDIHIIPWAGVLGLFSNHTEEAREKMVRPKQIRKEINSLGIRSIYLPALYVGKGVAMILFNGFPPSSGGKQRGRATYIKNILKNMAPLNEENKCFYSQDILISLDIFYTSPKLNKLPDIDNSQKFIIDALKGNFFGDDKQVENITVKRHNIDNALKPVRCSSKPETNYALKDISIAKALPLSWNTQYKDDRSYFVLEVQYGTN